MKPTYQSSKHYDALSDSMAQHPQKTWRIFARVCTIEYSSKHFYREEKIILNRLNEFDEFSVVLNFRDIFVFLKKRLIKLKMVYMVNRLTI